MAQSRENPQDRQRRAEAILGALEQDEVDAVLGPQGVSLRRLRSAEADLERAQTVGQMGSWRLDPRANVLNWSAENHRIFGIPEGTPLTYERFLQAVHPEDRAYVDQKWQAALQGEPYDIEHRVVVDGHLKWVREKAYLEFDEDGALQAGFGISQDITEQKQTEEALQATRGELERRVAERTAELEETIKGLQTEAARRELAEKVLRERSEKLENLSAAHQRRAKQLQALAGQLSVAEERERQRLAEVLHDDLQQILVGARFQLDLLDKRLGGDAAQHEAFQQISTLLQEATEKSRTLSHELSPATLREQGLVPALRWLVGQMRTQHGLSVDLAAGSAAEPATGAVKLFLYKAINELLFNVVKHAGQREARVEVRRAAGAIRAEVRDEGKGFDPQRLSTEEGGTGFGLLAIQERAELLGGRLEIESEPGDGSAFVLTVPEALAGDTARDEDPSTMAGQREGQGPSRAESSGTIRVLLADDHRVVREGLALLLADELDLKVVGEADNGKRAVALVGELRPDVVVMDVSMPVMNGVEATRVIGQEWPDVRVVALSMYEDDSLREEAFEAGTAAYLAKSGPSDDLLAAIRGEARA